MRRPLAITALVALAAWPTAGCDNVIPVGVSLHDGHQLVAVTPDVPSRSLDLLLVIDDSQSMETIQPALASAVSTDLLPVVADVPSLHIGVTSTNLGGGIDGLCNGDGDGGRLLGPEDTGAECAAAPSDAYIRDERDGERHVRNYAGPVTDSLSCLLQVGTLGCGFRQPLAAAALATDPDVNPGFVRPDATLGVLIVTDTDDCSAASRDLFDRKPCDDPFDPDSCPLGPPTTFRCFEHGVVCDQTDLRSAGDKSNCRAAGPSLMADPSALADTLRRRKAPGSRVVLGVIAPPPGPVRVDINEAGGIASLAPTCTHDETPLRPAPRLASMVGAFSGQASVGDLCDGVGAGVQRFAALLRDAMAARPCLRGPISDVSPEPGLQVDCEVYEVANFGSTEASWVALSPCSGGEKPCYEIEPDVECESTETGLSARVERVFPATSSNSVVVECATP